MTFTPEQLAKAKSAKNAEELLALAKAEGIALTEEEAAKYFADLHKEGELSDDELDNVSGGGCGTEALPSHEDHLAFYSAVTSSGLCCPVCGTSMDYVNYVTSKSGYSSYSIYYCPEGQVYFKRELLSRGGYEWHLDNGIN